MTENNEGLCLCCGDWSTDLDDREMCPPCAKLADECMAPQTFVYSRVKARGYVDGWTQEQFVGRNLFKLAEELGEAVRCTHIGDYHTGATHNKFTCALEIIGTGEFASRQFDECQGWRVAIPDPDALRSELADLQVVLFCAAEALGLDIVRAATEKAARDVERGVR